MFDDLFLEISHFSILSSDELKFLADKPEKLADEPKNQTLTEQELTHMKSILCKIKDNPQLVERFNINESHIKHCIENTPKSTADNKAWSMAGYHIIFAIFIPILFILSLIIFVLLRKMKKYNK